MNEFLWGALAMASWTAGLFFLRFWRLTHDRLFVFFALSFWALAANWFALGVLELETEQSHHVYWLRLLSFVLIIAGIVDKNRRTAREHEPPK
jgi:hypothetical protein